MARTIKESEHLERRNQILDAAQKLIYTKGYEQMAIQDILDDLKISKGAFYHYYASKQALLEALIGRIQKEAECLLAPIIEDPHLNALEKLNTYFSTAARWKTEQKQFFLNLVRVWYTDENAIVREKVNVAMRAWMVPVLNGLIQQGNAEGSFSAVFPNETGRVVYALFQDWGETFIDFLMDLDPQQNFKLPEEDMRKVEFTAKAYTDSLERILGASPGSLHLLDYETVKIWLG